MHALNTMKNDTNSATRRCSPQVHLDHDIMSGNNRVVRMAASLQNHASEIPTDTSNLADRSGRLSNAPSPLHPSELSAGSPSHLISLDVSDQHRKTIPECTSPEILNLASSVAGTNISGASPSNTYVQSTAVQAFSNSSALQCQYNVSQTKKSPTKRSVQLPILTSYADATNFAARFPELASEVLSRPLQTAATPGFANVESSKRETPHSKMLEHTADRPNWALAPEETADSNESARPESSSVEPDEMDVDVEAAAGICVSRFKQTKISVRESALGDVGSSFDLESPEQSRNKRGASKRRSSPYRRSQTANSHIRFGGMRGFRDKQGNSPDYSSLSASSPVDWTPNASSHPLPEASDAPNNSGREEEWPTSCHAWDIIDDRSPPLKIDDDWESSSVEAFWGGKGRTVGFPNSQRAPQIDRWSRPVVQASWDYPSSVPPEMPRSSQDLLYRSRELSQQPPMKPVQSSSAKKVQTRTLVGWMSPSITRDGITSRQHDDHPRSHQSRLQPDGANEWHASLPLRRILPGDLEHASSTVMDNRLNDISIPTSSLTTPSSRKSFVREAANKAEQPSESPVDIVKTRMFSQFVPLSPRPILFRADSWNSAAPYEARVSSRDEVVEAQKEPPVGRTAQIEVPEVAPVAADSNLPMKSVGYSMQLDGIVPSAPSPARTPGDLMYNSSEPRVNATTATAETLGSVSEPEVEPSVNETRRLHILKPEEQTIQSRPVASRPDLTTSKKRQRSLDSGDQSQIPLNASRGPEKPFAICEVPAYPSPAERLGEGKGEIDGDVLSQVKIFLEDPEVHCFSDTTISSMPERGSETQQDRCQHPEQHLEGYAWRMGRPVSGWRRGLLHQSLSQKYIPPPARRFPPTFGEKPGLPISEQNNVYTFKLPPIRPVPGSTSQNVKAAPEAQMKQPVSKVKLEAPQNTDATDAGRDKHTFATDVFTPEITILTELGQSSLDALRGTSPSNIANADTDLALGNCFEPSKSQLMSLSDSNCVLLERKTMCGALSSDKVETPDLLPDSQNSLLIMMASQSIDKENSLDGISSLPTPGLSNRTLSSQPSPKVVGALQWPPPSTRIASSIHEHFLPRQDSIEATDYSHYPPQPPSSSSSLNLFSSQNQPPTASVHDSAYAPIQGYHYEIPGIHSESHRHHPTQSYFRPELTQDLVGTSGWVTYPNFNDDVPYLINERGSFDITVMSPQNETRNPPQGEPPLVNSLLSQHSGFMPYISSRQSVPSGLAFRTQYPAGQDPSCFSSGRQYVSPQYSIASSVRTSSSRHQYGQYDGQKELSAASSYPLLARQNGKGYSSQDF